MAEVAWSSGGADDGVEEAVEGSLVIAKMLVSVKFSTNYFTQEIDFLGTTV